MAKPMVSWGWAQNVLSDGGISVAGGRAAAAAPTTGLQQCVECEPSSRGRASLGSRDGVVIDGLWTCCEQAAPGCAGCLIGPHAFDVAKCAQCGLWISVQDWHSTPCNFHPEPPRTTRWGAAIFPCCGYVGLNDTKYAQAAMRPAQNLRAWTAERNQLVDQQQGGRPLHGTARIPRGSPGGRAGCVVSSHVPMLAPGGVALRCTGCDEEVHEAHCPRCEAVLSQCNQCFGMVPVLSDTPLPPSTGSSTDDRPLLFTRPGVCRFHPGLYALNRRTKSRVRQRPDALVCPHPGCGKQLFTADDREHPMRCEYHPVHCPAGCDAPLLRRDLRGHAFDCPNERVACPNECGEYLLRRDTESHVKLSCPSTRLPCPRRCGASPNRRDLEAHAVICPNEPVSCIHGCGAGAARAAWRQADHDTVCTMAPVQCDMCYRQVSHRADIDKHKLTVCPVLTTPCKRCGERTSRKLRLLVHEPLCHGRMVFVAWRRWSAAKARARRDGVGDGDTSSDEGENEASRPNECAESAGDGFGCGFPGCVHVELASMAPRALLWHRRVCPFRPIPCQLRCGARLPSYLLANHLAEECPMRARPRKSK